MNRAAGRAVAAALLSLAAAPDGGVPAAAARPPLATGLGSVRAKVAGPISLSLRVASATVEVTAGASGEVRLSLEGGPPTRLSLRDAGGDRLEPEFGGRRRLDSGSLRVEVPRGSRLDLTSLDGHLTVRGVGGEIRARASSGDLDLIGASLVDAEAIDGEIDVWEASGPVTVHTVSGKVRVTTEGSASRLSIETASGDVEWRGACGRGCHADLDTVSGALRFLLDPASSFALSAISHSGRVQDGLGLRSLPSAASADAGAAPGWLHAVWGAGEGEIECETFSGDVLLRRR